MKRILPFLIGLFLLASCHETQEIVQAMEDDMQMETEPDLQMDEIPRLPRIIQGIANGFIYSSDKSDSSEVIVNYEFYSRQFSSNQMDSVYKDSVNAIVYNSIKYATFGDEKSPLEELSKNFIASRIDTFIAYGQEEADYLGSVMWSLELEYQLTEWESFVDLTCSGWDYTGGAHGNGFLYDYLIDRNTGKTLGVKDFFSDIEALNSIAEKYFRKMYDLSEDQSLTEAGFWFDEDEFSVNENFTFRGKSLVFFFNSYEIAPYVAGPTELSIPVKEVKQILKREI